MTALLGSLGILTLVTTLLGEGFVPLTHLDGVQVYRRSQSRGIELAAEGVVAAPPERVRQLLLDYAEHPRWVRSLRESRVLRSGASSLLVYQRLDLPIIHDRDFTIEVSWGEEGGQLWTRFRCANARGPGPRDGVVRVQLHQGEWRLQPVQGGRATRLVYRLRIDLGGALPGWMGRSKAGKDVAELFQSIRREVGSGRPHRASRSTPTRRRAPLDLSTK